MFPTSTRTYLLLLLHAVACAVPGVRWCHFTPVPSLSGAGAAFDLFQALSATPAITVLPCYRSGPSDTSRPHPRYYHTPRSQTPLRRRSGALLCSALLIAECGVTSVPQRRSCGEFGLAVGTQPRCAGACTNIMPLRPSAQVPVCLSRRHRTEIGLVLVSDMHHTVTSAPVHQCGMRSNGAVRASAGLRLVRRHRASHRSKRGWGSGWGSQPPRSIVWGAVGTIPSDPIPPCAPVLFIRAVVEPVSTIFRVSRLECSAERLLPSKVQTPGR